jgi:dehydrogenase/reductase SDR family protein 7B
MATYWITGASSGIGDALAHELSRQGNQVILSARNEKKLESVRTQLAHPDQARVLSFDLSDTKNMDAIIDKALALFGQIDVVILNAGLSQRSLAQETSLDVYRNLMEVNFFGNVALTQGLLPKFIARNAGQFVVITSLVGKFGTPFRTGYSASKHALHGYYDSLRAEMMMQNKNIDVTIICPGFVSTDISFNALSADGSATQVHDDSNAQGITPQEFAKRAIPVIKAKKYEDYIGGKEVLGVKLKRFFPTMFAKKIARAKVR